MLSLGHWEHKCQDWVFTLSKIFLSSFVRHRDHELLNISLKVSVQPFKSCIVQFFQSVHNCAFCESPENSSSLSWKMFQFGDIWSFIVMYNFLPARLLAHFFFTKDTLQYLPALWKLVSKKEVSRSVPACFHYMPLTRCLVMKF